MNNIIKSVKNHLFKISMDHKIETKSLSSEIIFYLKKSWKTIIIFGIFGVFASLFYLIYTPNQYQATVRISILSVPSENDVQKDNQIEGPLELINNIRLLNIVNESLIHACGIQREFELFGPNSKDIILREIKMDSSYIELRVRRQSVVMAKLCTEEIYKQILKYQVEQRDLFLSNYMAKQKNSMQSELEELSNRLDEDKILINRLIQSRELNGNLYFTVLNNMRNLKDKKNQIMSKNIDLKKYYKISKPMINISDTPTYPKVNLSIVLGLVCGLMIGSLIVLLNRFKLR